ncbi:DNA polymerase III subunit delta' [Patescibacteria group bacterium]|nr:DNA polymerase III subunit delta' [Patescibacteria group bacterium]MBU4162426.1 DNA polymerase III subunit delta' [Patescibacteria group bacterium]
MIIGHNKQWEFLSRCIQNDRVAHAYLFYGPLNIGKRTIAMEFIKLLNCRNPNIEPCGKCESCERFENGIPSSLFFLKPEPPENSEAEDEGKNLAIRVERIFQLKLGLSLSSAYAGYKVAIIDDSDAMTYDAQGALLKILEEPKGKTVIILIAEQPDKLLQTIVSRCQLIRFDLLQQKRIEESLIKNNASAKLAKEISWLSFGRPGLAMEYYKNPETAELQKKRITDIVKLLSAPLSSRFKYAEALSKDTKEMYFALDIWLSFFRELLLESLGKEKNIFMPAKCNYSKTKIRSIIGLIEKIGFVIKTTNTNPRLAMEVLLMKI